jgi:threonine synthase
MPRADRIARHAPAGQTPWYYAEKLHIVPPSPGFRDHRYEHVNYVSTRGKAPPLSFDATLLSGLASDGGLYLPESYPRLSDDAIAELAGRPYSQVADAIISPYAAGVITPADLRAMIDAACAVFRHKAVAPLVQIDANLFVLELFHGPTLAFKDLAMQLLARLIDHALEAKGERATIIGATSGDTGAAAIQAFAGLPRVDIVILYPHGRVSDVQRRQMTTVDAPNVHAVAIEGTFDDAQAAVKALFGDQRLCADLRLCGVNSINIARILAQIVYYVTSATALGAPRRDVSFVVPTGNFGDIFAGWIAKRMGLSIEKLVIATNANDILQRAISTGRYELAEVAATQSPSMDIQVSSNFERLLFEAYGRDGDAVAALMAELGRSRAFAIARDPLDRMRAEFAAFSTDEAETTREIARTWRESAYIADPHTAVGLSAARRAQAQRPATPHIVLGTAHPAKFPAAIEQAIGQAPALPEPLVSIHEKKEKIAILPNDLRTIERFIRERARAGGATASSRAAS